MTITLRPAEASDMPEVCALVNHFIATSTIDGGLVPPRPPVNFRTAPQTPGEWLADWTAQRARYPWLVATRDGRVVGVAYAATWKARAAYDWCAEVTVYVAHDRARQGIGRRLYERLLPLLDAQGHRTEVAVIALPNDASVALHEAFGFVHAGTLREVGWKHDAWRDVGFWQRRGRTDEVAPPIGPVAR